MSLLINLAVALTLAGAVLAAALIWASRRERKRQERIRQRGPDATLRSDRSPEKDTDQWNITR